MRLFFAIEVPNSIKASLALARKEIPQQSSWRWVKPELFHVTVLFLGECRQEQLEPLKAAAEEVAREHSAFSLKCRSLGTFGRGRKDPRVLWAGFDDSKQFRALCLDLADRVKLALELKEPFEKVGRNNHLTLARRRRGKWGAFELPLKLAGMEWGEWSVAQFVLMESLLASSGPVYRKVGAWKLAP